MIDKAIIEQLKKDVGNELAVELLKTFVNESKKTVAILISKNELSEIEMSAHSLKSSCYSFGASDLGDTCKQIEALVKVEHSQKDLNTLLKTADEQSKVTFKKLATIIENIQI
ncbi:diguanylate cyclase [Pseudoalteromonas aliena]|uniref:Diguanylate cyclase n=1 Tax=Pseudoalteromonas aliena TaxID=247523 RepID=A0A1Q2H152_9GAMM|nr:Hpt domain-containing protein [Pseudoalteromonas aliena]AQQ01057.1 diguanylate cyclase [Pseudoalteromonas aliena]